MRKFINLSLIAVACMLTACGQEAAENSNNTNEANTSAVSEVADELNSLYSEDFVTLGDYKGVELKLDVKEPTDEEISAQIASDLSSIAQMKEVTDRAVQDGDIVNIDYVGTKDGVAFDGGTASGYNLTIGSGQFIPGFESGLVGAKKGDNLDLNLTFPENYGASELAGADVVFNVTVNSISEEITPELNDETVAKIGQGYDSVEAYKESIRDSIYDNNTENAKMQLKNDILEKIVSNSTIKDTPEWLISSMTENVKSSAVSYANMYGISLDDFVSQALNETMEEFEEECATFGKNNAQQTLVAYAIAEKENLKIGDDELNEKLGEYMSMYGMSDEEMETSGQKQYMTIYLQTEKIVDYLMDNAKVTDASGNVVKLD